MNRKNAEEKFFIFLAGFATYSIIALLLILVIAITVKGYRACSWEMITQTPRGGFYFGEQGGILNAIIGSLYLAGGAAVLAFLVSLPIALYINIYLTRQQRIVHFIRVFMDILWGIPSIVYGAFGFTLMVYLGMRASLLAGIITVALLIIPIMVRSMDEVMKSIPSGLLETSLSLGSTRTEISFRIYLRQAFSGIINAVLLAFGRGIGDAASVLFTAGYTDHIPTGLDQPTATLPLAIFFQLTSPIPQVQNRAYASALILTLIILVISLAARKISYKYKEHNIL
jgi:phosphate transport system permease protein